MIAEYEEDYFIWLCAKVTEPTSVGQTYWSLLRELHTYEFVWVVPGDANRMSDGFDMKTEFCRAFDLPPDIFDEYDRATRVSVLEVLVAFTRHAEFQTECSEVFWFTTFLKNLDLIDEYDAGGIDEERIRAILYNFVWRLYEPNGEGGLFPLSSSRYDQREIELWFQFFEYIDQEMIGG